MPSVRALLLLVALHLASETADAADPPPTLAINLGQGVALDCVLIKAGAFEQGSPSGEPGRGGDETQRRVTLTRDYYLARTPVTRAQFARFVAETHYNTEAERGTSGGFGFDGTALAQRKEFTWRNPGFAQTDDHPVTVVTYNDARAFAEWVSRRARRHVALPTEAQWEYACRAGTTTAFYDGTDDPGAIAWTRENAGDGTRPVGRKKANAWGLADMAGNVFEWCRDWHGPYEAGPVTDPERTQPAGGKPRRVLRGGSWLRAAKFARSAARYRNDPASRNADNGFRVVAALTAEPAAAAPVVHPAPPVTITMEPVSAPPMPTFLPPPAPGFQVGGLCMALLVLGVLALIARGVLRGLRAGAVSPTPAGRIITRPDVDGFWIDNTELPVGTTIHYFCLVHGAPREEQFTIVAGPKGRFVYTGGPASEIRIVPVIVPQTRDDSLPPWASSPGTGSWSPPPRRTTPPPVRHPSPPPQHHPNPIGWTGHPPAY
jgi:sulfatase modifying factor 1